MRNESTFSTGAKPKGWFSRRHETSAAHYAAKRARQEKRAESLFNSEQSFNVVARGKRSAKEQVARLDAKLGVGVGAVRERARLSALLAPVVA